MTKYYAIYHKEMDRPMFPIDRLLTKAEAEEELAKQDKSEELEIREVAPPAEES